MTREKYEEWVAFLERNSGAWCLTQQSDGSLLAYHRHYEWDGQNASSIQVVERFDEWKP